LIGRNLKAVNVSMSKQTTLLYIYVYIFIINVRLSIIPVYSVYPSQRLTLWTAHYPILLHIAKSKRRASDNSKGADVPALRSLIAIDRSELWLRAI